MLDASMTVNCAPDCPNRQYKTNLPSIASSGHLPPLALPALLIAAALAASAQTSKVAINPVPRILIQQRLESVASKLSDRRAALLALFREAGCDGENLTTQKVPRSAEPNLICTLPAAEPAAGVIVVGGHYDRVNAGMGAVDDWSGAVLLPSLYQSLKSAPRRHTYVFIAFAAEETGLNGSTEYVHRLAKPARAEIRAMINLECLGLSPPKVWSNRADKQLLTAYAGVSRSLGMVVAGSNVDNVGDDDSHPFLSAKIPVLTIHSLTQENFRILHTQWDQLKAIQPDDYYMAYRLTSVYLAFLDSFLLKE
jgi:hypothetical protein